jgi:hypothetical protein
VISLLSEALLAASGATTGDMYDRCDEPTSFPFALGDLKYRERRGWLPIGSRRSRHRLAIMLVLCAASCSPAHDP